MQISKEKYLLGGFISPWAGILLFKLVTISLPFGLQKGIYNFLSKIDRYDTKIIYGGLPIVVLSILYLLIKDSESSWPNRFFKFIIYFGACLFSLILGFGLLFLIAEG